MARLMVLSADGHGGPRLEHLREYLTDAHRAGFDELVAPYELFEVGKDAPSDAPAVFGSEAQRIYHREFIETGRIGGNWDSELRLKELDDDGVAAEVMFFHSGWPPSSRRPNFILNSARRMALGSMVGEGTAFEPERELSVAVTDAYHRWLVDFIAMAPERRVGQVSLSFNDIDADVRKIEWAAEHGLKGVTVPPFEDKRPPHHHPRYEPIWAAAEANELTVALHAAPARPWEYGGPGVDPVTLSLIAETELNWWGRRPLWLMMWGGVFERHPKLHFAMTELGGTWIPSTIAFMDAKVDNKPSFENSTALPKDIRKLLSMKPSEYIARQVFFGVSFWTQAEVELRHEIGIDSMMFGVDFPHIEGTSGYTREWLGATLGPNEVPEDEMRKIVGGNLARCYRIDVDTLVPTVERIGPTIDEVLSGTNDLLPHHLATHTIGNGSMRSIAHA